MAYQNYQQNMYVLLAIFLLLIIFSVGRSLTLWYFGISQIHRNQEKIIALLSELNGHPIKPDAPKSPTVARAELPAPKPSPYDLQKS